MAEINRIEPVEREAGTGVEQLCVNSLRVLAIDAIQKANSGHPGTPMGMAPAAFVLWTRLLRHNPKNPNWYGRDRFHFVRGPRLDAAVRASVFERMHIACSRTPKWRFRPR